MSMPSIHDVRWAAGAQPRRGAGMDTRCCPPLQGSAVVVVAKSVVFDHRFDDHRFDGGGDKGCAVVEYSGDDDDDDASSVSTATTIDEGESSSSRWDASSPSESSAERGMPRIPARSSVAGGGGNITVGPLAVVSFPTAVAPTTTIIPSKVWEDAHLDRSKSLPRSPSRSMRVLLRPMPLDEDERHCIQDIQLVARHSDHQGRPTLCFQSSHGPTTAKEAAVAPPLRRGRGGELNFESVPGPRAPR